MEKLLRRFAEWKARRRGAQIIIFDGGAEVEKTRSFMRGVFVGAGIAVVAFALTGPTAMDSALTDQIKRRDDLLRESNSRTVQAIRVADVCLSTAQNLERTLATYQQFLGNNSGARGTLPRNPVTGTD